MRNGARRAALAALCVVAAATSSAALPLAASAFLPDGRVYEQVTPPNKEGNFIFPRGCCFGGEYRGFAEASGNGVVYATSGAVQGTSTSGNVQAVVSRRTAGQGWYSSSALPSQLGFISLFVTDIPIVDFSPDFSKVAWLSHYRYSKEEPEGPNESVNMFLGGADPLAAPAWLGKPGYANAFPAPGHLSVPNDGTGLSSELVGMSADGSTVFFTYAGTLLEADELPLKPDGSPGGRRENIGEGDSRTTPPIAWGFYEWHNGQLAEAGELPNGTLNPFGAVPAAFAGVNYPPRFNGETADWEVSRDGTKAYFVSPDPLSTHGGGPNCPGCQEAPQLYVREIMPSGERKSVLVSHSELPGQQGKEAEDGVSVWGNPPGESYEPGQTYVYGSPDGSHAYFASRSLLTSDAPKRTKVIVQLPWNTNGGTFTITAKGEGTEGTTGPIAYNASAIEVKAALEALSNVEPGSVTVEGGPLSYSAGKAGRYEITISGKSFTITADGSKLAVETGIYIGDLSPAYWYDFDTATGKVSYMKGLEGAYTRYSGQGVAPAAVSNDGSRAVFYAGEGETRKLEVWTSNSEGGSVESAIVMPPAVNYFEGGITPARASADGNVFMFESNSKFPQFNDGGGHRQIFRYEVSSKELTCVSCPPAGVNPTGDIETPIASAPITIQPNRDMSEDGSRIFFDTPDPLVGADTNGKRDVYEWENGHVYLITAGTGVLEDAHYIDNSASGGDVFFITEAGLVPGDKDQAGDVYDARIPQPGDNPPPSAVPCEGDVCQGPPAVPQLLTPAASSVFNGLGNIPPEVEKAPPPPTKCAKGFVMKNGKCARKPKKKRKKAKQQRRKHKSNRRGK